MLTRVGHRSRGPDSPSRSNELVWTRLDLQLVRGGQPNALAAFIALAPAPPSPYLGLMQESVAPSLRHPGPPQAPQFLADAMLERLARWLRVLGYDVRSTGPAGAQAALERGAASGRILLTRNRALAVPGAPGGSLLVQHQAPLDQLVEVLTQLDLRPPWVLFTRCLLCSTPLLPGAPADRPRVEPGEGVVTHRCPSCGRLYWEGVHTRRMRAALSRALGPGVAARVG